MDHKIDKILLISYVDRTLSDDQAAMLRRLIITNPDVIDEINRLARMKRMHCSGSSLAEYLDFQKEELRNKIASLSGNLIS